MSTVDIHRHSPASNAKIMGNSDLVLVIKLFWRLKFSTSGSYWFNPTRVRYLYGGIINFRANVHRSSLTLETTERKRNFTREICSVEKCRNSFSSRQEKRSSSGLVEQDHKWLELSYPCQFQVVNKVFSRSPSWTKLNSLVVSREPRTKTGEKLREPATSKIAISVDPHDWLFGAVETRTQVHRFSRGAQSSPHYWKTRASCRYPRHLNNSRVA